MTDTQTENGTDLEDELPPEDEQGQDSSGEEQAAPPPQPSARERELERRLSMQGNELATMRRTLNTSVTELQQQIRNLTSNLSQRDQSDAEQRERDRDAYLATLPADRRALEEVKLHKQDIKALAEKPRTDAQQPRAAQQPAQDPDEEYMRQRVLAIVKRAQTRYGVTLTPEEIRQLPEDVWSDETDFHDAVYDLAERKVNSGRSNEGEDQMANGKSGDAPRRSNASPAAPRAAQTRAKQPTEEDVKQAVSAYDSRSGPKANIERLKKMRSGMKAE